MKTKVLSFVIALLFLTLVNRYVLLQIMIKLAPLKTIKPLGFIKKEWIVQKLAI